METTKNSQQIINAASIIILIAAVISFLVLINFMMFEKLGQAQMQAQNNANRLAQIENFLNQQLQAAQTQMQATQQTKPVATSTAPTKVK
jgi:hypothetical protein